MRQTIFVRNIPQQLLYEAYTFLKEQNLLPQYPKMQLLVSCTVADTCRLGIVYQKGHYKRFNKKS
jgi:sulfite reductase beta subunit-like hemoprotein